ncbi:VOC family protein [Variovorax sp. 22077]|uniref:VOC family protein n=1 Tax=Variovorax sp. 22077 TaxID=3453867 RepID=UPI003F85F079
MKFASVRLVTLDVERLIAFYAQLSGVAAVGLADGFAEFRLPGATLAISAQQLIQRFNAGAAPAAANRSAILEFEVDDVDRVSSLLGSAAVIVQEPTLMPWGNRSLLLRDPDGSLVNIFSRLRAFELPRLP